MSPLDRRYYIQDGQTGKLVSKGYASRKRAQHRADKLDLIYGAIRYYVIYG